MAMFTEVWIRDCKTHEKYRVTIPGSVGTREVRKELRLARCARILSLNWVTVNHDADVKKGGRSNDRV